MADFDELKMEFLMKLQCQDYVAAEAIQKELLKQQPGNKLIREFSKLLPDEVQAQKEAQSQDQYGEEYYDEEEDKEDEKEDEEDKDDEKDEEEGEVKEQKPAEGEEEIKQGEKKEGEEEDEYDEDAYGEEDYDAEGKYIWGKEGTEWDYYYKEDKEAHERGDPVHPSVINTAPIRSQKDEDLMSLASTTTTSSTGVYKTKKKWRPTQ
ncbi:UNKNOWN [Stylonychia lemnae]|uniref:Uncharacterized protein n=1 Tax=Stylonychia lemnae TaxID=5949 RepID=A0A078AUD9_STYLE|nr:UNKNOWN [Stylonychia lemnae]|eukprot:CDW84847.1 UNKNOWN [Stylonychia lemnae]